MTRPYAYSGPSGSVFVAAGERNSGDVSATMRIDGADVARVLVDIVAAHRGARPGEPPLVIDKTDALRLACCLRDVATELARDGRADPLPIARLLAQCAEIIGMACPTCGGTGRAEYTGPDPAADYDQPCPACKGAL